MSNQNTKTEKKKWPLSPEERLQEKPLPMIRGLAFHEDSTGEKPKSSIFAVTTLPKKTTEKEESTITVEGHIKVDKESLNQGAPEQNQEAPGKIKGLEKGWRFSQQQEKTLLAYIHRLLPQAPYQPTVLRHINEDFQQWTKTQQDERSQVIFVNNRQIQERPEKNYFVWLTKMDPKERTGGYATYDPKMELSHNELTTKLTQMKNGRLPHEDYIGPQTEAPYLLLSTVTDEFHTSHCCKTREKYKKGITYSMNCHDVNRELENCRHAPGSNPYILTSWFNETKANISKIIFLRYAVFNRIKERSDKKIKHLTLLDDLPCTMDEYRFMCLNDTRTMRNVEECDELRILLQNLDNNLTEYEWDRLTILTYNRVVSHPSNREVEYGTINRVGHNPSRCGAINKKIHLINEMDGNENNEDYMQYGAQRRALEELHTRGLLPLWFYDIKKIPVYKLFKETKVAIKHKEQCSLRGPDNSIHYINSCQFIHEDIPKRCRNEYGLMVIEDPFYTDIKSDKEVVAITEIKIEVWTQVENFINNPPENKNFEETTNFTELEWGTMTRYDKGFYLTIIKLTRMASIWTYQRPPEIRFQNEPAEETYHTTIPRDEATVRHNPFPTRFLPGNRQNLTTTPSMETGDATGAAQTPDEPPPIFQTNQQTASPSEDLPPSYQEAAIKPDMDDKKQAERRNKRKKTLKRVAKYAMTQLTIGTLAMLMGYLISQFPKAYGETKANKNFIYKDWGPFILNPTRIGAIKTINHTQFQERYKELAALTSSHKRLCGAKFKKPTIKKEDMIRAQFNATMNEFALNDVPRNYQESKQFCENLGAHLPELRRYPQRDSARNLSTNYRPNQNYFPAGIESRPGMKEALYFTDKEVATISHEKDKANVLKMHAFFASLCKSQSRTSSEKSWEHYIGAYYPKDGDTPFYYITYKDHHNKNALDLCPLESKNTYYAEDKDAEYHKVGVARTSHTICQFPNFTTKNYTKFIIYDDEAKHEVEAKQDYEFFKDFCTINNNILETMTKEMKLLVDSIDPSKARDINFPPVNFDKTTNINRKRRHSSSSLDSYDSDTQEQRSISSGGSKSYNSESFSGKQSKSERYKTVLVKRPHRAAGAIAATILGTIAISPLVALLNVAVVDSVYGNDDEQNNEFKLKDFEMGDRSLNSEINKLKQISQRSFGKNGANKKHRDLIHAESSLIHVFDSIYDKMKISTNNLIALATQANRGTATPAWLSKEELSVLKANFAIKNLTMIETDYKRITMSLHRRNNNYIIKYGLPVLENEKKVRLYFITPIPVFKNNNTFTAIVEHPVVAISYTGRFYTPMTLQEANNCLETPTCQADSPTYEATYTMCGASDYFIASNQCTYSEKPGTRPFFKTIGRVVYYNLPKNESLFIHCFDEALNRPGEEKEMKLQAKTGNITLPMTCQARTSSIIIMTAGEDIQTSTTKSIDIPKYVNDQTADLMTYLSTNMNVIVDTPIGLIKDAANNWFYDSIFNKNVLAFIIIVSTAGTIICMRAFILEKLCQLCRGKCQKKSHDDEEQIKTPSEPSHTHQAMRTTSDDYDETSPGSNKTGTSTPRQMPKTSTFIMEEDQDYMTPPQPDLSISLVNLDPKAGEEQHTFRQFYNRAKETNV